MQGMVLWSEGISLFLFYPIFNLYSFNMFEVLRIMCNHCKTSNLGSTANQKVEVFYGSSDIPQSGTLFGECFHTVGKREHLHISDEVVCLLQVFFYLFASVSSEEQLGHYNLGNETTFLTNLIQLGSHIAVASEQSYYDACVKKIAVHDSTSIVLAVLALRMSSKISSALRLSFHAPTNRSAQPASVLAFFSLTSVLTNASISSIAVSLSSNGLISRNSSARSCIAVIILTCLVLAAKIQISERKAKFPHTFLFFSGVQTSRLEVFGFFREGVS